MSTDAILRRLADRAELEDLVARHSVWVDEGRWDETDRIFTGDVVITSPRGGELHGIDAVVEHVRRSQGTFARTLHNKANLVIDLDGDTADVRAHDIGVFAIDDTTAQVAGGIARYRAVRTPAGWRFAGLALEAVALTAAIDRAL
jgi:hypothetical protein